LIKIGRRGGLALSQTYKNKFKEREKKMGRPKRNGTKSLFGGERKETGISEGGGTG